MPDDLKWAMQVWLDEEEAEEFFLGLKMELTEKGRINVVNLRTMLCIRAEAIAQ